jgi:Protein of unknown function (DUF3147)
VGELVVRFLVGGAVVSFFALVGDLFKPKSFAGLFAAAPSVALATLALTIIRHGSAYAAAEARSMILGAVAFLIYVFVAGLLLLRHKLPAKPVALLLLPGWVAAALGLWYVLLAGR